MEPQCWRTIRSWLENSGPDRPADLDSAWHGVPQPIVTRRHLVPMSRSAFLCHRAYRSSCARPVTIACVKVAGGTECLTGGGFIGSRLCRKTGVSLCARPQVPEIWVADPCRGWPGIAARLIARRLTLVRRCMRHWPMRFRDAVSICAEYQPCFFADDLQCAPSRFVLARGLGAWCRIACAADRGREIQRASLMSCLDIMSGGWHSYRLTFEPARVQADRSFTHRPSTRRLAATGGETCSRDLAHRYSAAKRTNLPLAIGQACHSDFRASSN